MQFNLSLSASQLFRSVRLFEHLTPEAAGSRGCRLLSEVGADDIGLHLDSPSDEIWQECAGGVGAGPRLPPDIIEDGRI